MQMCDCVHTCIWYPPCVLPQNEGLHLINWMYLRPNPPFQEHVFCQTKLEGLLIVSTLLKQYIHCSSFNCR